MDEQKARIPSEIPAGQETLLTEAQRARDNPGQSGSVCLDEFRDLAHSCVPTGQDEDEGLEKLVHLYSAANPQRNASRTQLLRKYLELGTAAAAAEHLKMSKRTAQEQVADFKAFAIAFLKKLHRSRAESDEVAKATAEQRATRRRQAERDFDAAWLQCKEQCPGSSKHTSEAPASYDRQSNPRPEDIGSGCSICPLSPFWEAKKDRATDRVERERNRKRLDSIGRGPG